MCNFVCFIFVTEAVIEQTPCNFASSEPQGTLEAKKSKKHEPWTQDEMKLLLSRWKSAMLRKGGNFPSNDDLQDFIEENQNIFKPTRTVMTTRSFMHKFIQSKHAKDLLM